MPPQETKPAPPPLLLVQSFINTWDSGTGTDLLASPDAAAGWLRRAGLAGPHAAVRPAGLRQAREVRESLRALLALNAGGPRPATEQLAPLHALARAGHPRLSVDPAGRMLLGTWCDMATCGNMIKNRNFRARHRQPQ